MADAAETGPKGTAGRTLIGLLLAAALLAFWWPSVALPVLDLESLNVVLMHAGYKGWGGLAALASPDYFGTFGEGGYRPLTTLVYFLTNKLSGADPFGYKLVKLALHFANSVLVYAIALRLLGSRPWALAGALFYHVRLAFPAFDGMAFLPDILAATFSLAATLAHVASARSPAASRLTPLLTAFLYLCALLSKEMSALLPVALLVHDLAFPPGGPRWRALVRRNAPMWLALAAFLAVLGTTVRAQSFYGSLDWAWPRPWWKPAAMLRDYGRGFFDPSGLIPWWLAAAGCLAVALEAAARRPAGFPWRLAAFLLAWAVLALAPVVNVLPFPKFLSYFRAATPRYLALGGAALACLPGLLARRQAGGRLAEALLAVLLAWGIVFQAYDALLRRKAWGPSLPADLQTELQSILAIRRDSPPFDYPMLESRFGKLLLSLPSFKRRAPARWAEASAVLLAGLPAGDGRLLLDWFGREDLYADGREARHAMRLMMAGDFRELMDWHRAELSYREGLAALKRGAAGDALPLLRSAWRLNERHYPACYSLAEALRAKGDGGAAWQQAALCEDIWRTTVSRGLAETAYREDFKTLAGQALLGKADAAAARRDYAAAGDFYARAAREVDFMWPEHWAALRELDFLRTGARRLYNDAMDAFLAGDRRRALDGFGQTIAANPRFAQAYVSRAALRDGMGDAAGAQRDYARALAQPLTSGLRGVVYSSRAAAKAKKARPARRPGTGRGA